MRLLYLSKSHMSLSNRASAVVVGSSTCQRLDIALSLQASHARSSNAPDVSPTSTLRWRLCLVTPQKKICRTDARRYPSFGSNDAFYWVPVDKYLSGSHATIPGDGVLEPCTTGIAGPPTRACSGSAVPAMLSTDLECHARLLLAHAEMRQECQERRLSP